MGGIGWRAAVVVGGLTLAALVVRPDAGAASSPARPALARHTVVHGVVGADGVPTGPSEGWQVQRVDLGHYVLHLHGTGTADVLRWDEPVAVHVVPARDGSVEISFGEPGAPVDSRFTFAAG